MKWEYRIAALLMALVLLLAARGLWSRYQAEKYVPTLVTWGGEPFFPRVFRFRRWCAFGTGIPAWRSEC